jgi:hypothetical protein
MTDREAADSHARKDLVIDINEGIQKRIWQCESERSVGNRSRWDGQEEGRKLACVSLGLGQGTQAPVAPMRHFGGTRVLTGTLTLRRTAELFLAIISASEVARCLLQLSLGS